MNKRIIFGFVSAAVLALFVQVGPAFATPVTSTINLDQVYTGATPDGSPAWLVATFTGQTGTNTGTLTLTSNLSSSDFLQGLENSSASVGWAFYVDDPVTTFSCVSGSPCASSYDFNALGTEKGNSGLYHGGVNSGPVTGGFNLGFGWDVNSRFMAGDSVTYDLTFANDFTSSPFTANNADWTSMAHVQGIGAAGCSSFIVAGTGTDASGPDDEQCGSTPPPVAVPEPAALGMLGFGVLLIGVFAGLRRRYN